MFAAGNTPVLWYWEAQHGCKILQGNIDVIIYENCLQNDTTPFFLPVFIITIVLNQSIDVDAQQTIPLPKKESLGKRNEKIF